MSGRGVERAGRSFFRVDAETLARRLLGQRLVRVLDDGTRLAGLIVETEAYLGEADRAAHTYGGRRTARNESMWRDGGTAYVYFTYGMHHCMNVVASREGDPVAVLIRALEPVEGIDAMARLRGGREKFGPGWLCGGPARLTRALAIDRALDGEDMVTSDRLFIERVRKRGLDGRSVCCTARVGVGYAGEWADRPLRWFVKGNPNVSRTRGSGAGTSGGRGA